MASGHGFTVLANASVHRPINPKTGLVSASFENGKQAVKEDRRDEEKTQTNQPSTNSSAELVSDEFNQSADADFYQRLMEMKEAHKKTVAMWEKIYKETHSNIQDDQNVSLTRSRLASLENLLSSPVRNETDSFRDTSRSGRLVHDHVKDLSYLKPPSGRPVQSDNMPGNFTKTTRSNAQVFSYESSLNDDFSAGEISADEHDPGEHGSTDHIDTRSNAIACIDDMWEHFSVDNYCPRSSLPPSRGVFKSSSMSNLSTRPSHHESSKPQKKVTVPEPFSMSVRDAGKVPRKSKAALELEQREEERKRQEELECQKKFKAVPLPAHVHLRLYDELKEARESRRRSIVEQRQQILQTIQKPFQFSLRDEEKKKLYSSSAAARKSKSHAFKAHPFPSHIFSDNVTEKMLEEEMYRKIRKKQHAKELMRSSSLPPTMKRRGKDYFDARLRQQEYADRAKKAGIAADHKFRPRINDTIPDFDKQYERFLREMSQRKQMRESTVCKPFNLRTSTMDFRRSRNSKSGRSHNNFSDDESLQENQRPLRSSMSMSFSGSYSPGFDVIPSKTTQSTLLRASANRQKLQKTLEKEEKEKQKQSEHLGKSRELKKTILERSVSMDNSSLENEIKEKLKIKKRAEREMTENYKKSLNEINQRVQQRPLLFEQTIQRKARQDAERKYRETLSKTGFDMESLLEKASAAGTDSFGQNDTYFIDETKRDEDSYSERQASRRNSQIHRWSPTGGVSASHDSVGQGSRAASGAASPSRYENNDDNDESDEHDGSFVEEELECEPT